MDDSQILLDKQYFIDLEAWLNMKLLESLWNQPSWVRVPTQADRNIYFHKDVDKHTY